MLRVCIGLGLVACLFALLEDANACHRRRCRQHCCPSTDVCDANGSMPAVGGGGAETIKTKPSVTGGPSAEEMRWWESMVKKEYVTKDQFDELWKNSTPAERKKFYDNILKVEKDAAEKAEKELKEKEKLEKKKSKTDGDKQANAAPVPAPATMVITLPADARVRVQGVSTSSTSTSRVLVSPDLQRGKDFVYTVEAEIMRDGWSLTQTQQVRVRGGETTYVPFRFSPNEVASR